MDVVARVLISSSYPTKGCAEYCVSFNVDDINHPLKKKASETEGKQ